MTVIPIQSCSINCKCLREPLTMTMLKIKNRIVNAKTTIELTPLSIETVFTSTPIKPDESNRFIKKRGAKVTEGILEKNMINHCLDNLTVFL